MKKKNIEDFQLRRNKRNAYEDVLNFIHSDICYEGKLFVLFGCHSKGKTTIMEQVIQNYENPDKCVYYQVEDTDDMCTVYVICSDERDKGTEIIFLDEITRAKDFEIESGGLPGYAEKGMKIIITGNDSLTITFASFDELKDSLEGESIDYISFIEHCKIFNVNDIDDYIQHGGVMEEITVQKERIIHDYKSTCEYIKKAISDNIGNSIHRIGDEDIEELSNEEINFIIKNMIETYSGQFHKIENSNDPSKITIKCPSLKICVNTENDFVKNLITENNEIKQNLFHKINSNKIIKQKISQDVIKKMEFYLYILDVLIYILKIQFFYNPFNNEWEEGSTSCEYYIYQPSLKYYFLKEKSKLIETEFSKNLHYENENNIRDILDEKIKNEIMKQIVLISILNCLKNEEYDVVKVEFYKSNVKLKEYDTIIYDKKNNKHWLFEINHTEIPCYTGVNNCHRNIIEKKYGILEKFCVLYKGNSLITTSNIIYFNVTTFLKTLEKHRDIQKTIDELIHLI